jgi:hypothetical protein
MRTASRVIPRASGGSVASRMTTVVTMSLRYRPDVLGAVAKSAAR